MLGVHGIHTDIGSGDDTIKQTPCGLQLLLNAPSYAPSNLTAIATVQIIHQELAMLVVARHTNEVVDTP